MAARAKGKAVSTIVPSKPQSYSLTFLLQPRKHLEEQATNSSFPRDITTILGILAGGIQETWMKGSADYSCQLSFTISKSDTQEVSLLPREVIQLATKTPQEVLAAIEASPESPMPALSLANGRLIVQAHCILDRSAKSAIINPIDDPVKRVRKEPLVNLLEPEPSMSNFQRSEVVSAVLKDQTAVLSKLGKINVKLDSVLDPLITETQDFLQSLEGIAFDDLGKNQQVAVAIQHLLNRLGVRVKCPRPDCNEPSVLDCRQAGRTKFGIFQFRHSYNGHYTNHTGSTRLPLLSLLKLAPNAKFAIKRLGK